MASNVATGPFHVSVASRVFSTSIFNVMRQNNGEYTLSAQKGQVFLWVNMTTEELREFLGGAEQLIAEESTS